MIMIELSVKFGAVLILITLKKTLHSFALCFSALTILQCTEIFFGELDEAWNKAKEVYDNIPDVVDNKWLEENGFESFYIFLNQIQIEQKDVVRNDST